MREDLYYEDTSAVECIWSSIACIIATIGIYMKNPELIPPCIGCIGFIVCGIFAWQYFAVSNAPAEWIIMSDEISHDYRPISAPVEYLNGYVWFYGHYTSEYFHYPCSYRVNVNNTDDIFKIESGWEMNYSFDSSIWKSLSDAQSNTIWTVNVHDYADINKQQVQLVSFKPPINTTVYNIPFHGQSQYETFWVQCITKDIDSNILYILGGWSEGGNYAQYKTNMGDVYLFDISSKSWIQYYNNNSIGNLVTQNDQFIFNYACSFNNDNIFIYGGAYISKRIWNATNEIHILSFQNDVKWRKLENTSLMFNVAPFKAFTKDDNVHIWGGCEYYSICYISHHVFNLASRSITDYMKSESEQLQYGQIAVNNYDKSEVYFMSIYEVSFYEVYLYTTFWRYGTNAQYNKTYLMVGILSAVIFVMCCGAFYCCKQSIKRSNGNEKLINYK